MGDRCEHRRRGLTRAPEVPVRAPVGSGGPQALRLRLGAEGSSVDDRKAYMEDLVKDIIETARSLSERKPAFYRRLNSSTLSSSSARDRETLYLLDTNTRGREVLRLTR